MKRADAAGIAIVLPALALAGVVVAACGDRHKDPAPAEAAGEAAPSPPETGGPLVPLPTHLLRAPGGETAPDRATTPDGGTAPGSGMPPGSGESAGMRWTAPAEWIETTPASPMRRAQYRIPAAPGDREDGECVVYYFGAGQGGDQRANASRWVAQFAGPGSESPRLEEIQAGGLTVNRVEVGGTYTPSPMSMTAGAAPEPKKGYRLLGAIAPGPDANWFFKCTGPDRTMQANRSRFDALVRSIRIAR